MRPNAVDEACCGESNCNWSQLGWAPMTMNKAGLTSSVTEAYFGELYRILQVYDACFYWVQQLGMKPAVAESPNTVNEACCCGDSNIVNASCCCEPKYCEQRLLLRWFKYCEWSLLLWVQHLWMKPAVAESPNTVNEACCCGDSNIVNASCCCEPKYCEQRLLLRWYKYCEWSLLLWVQHLWMKPVVAESPNTVNEACCCGDSNIVNASCCCCEPNQIMWITPIAAVIQILWMKPVVVVSPNTVYEACCCSDSNTVNDACCRGESQNCE